MKDFPVFPTAYGAASLILKEIPYRQECYIKIQDSKDPEKLLEECISFCRACGAEKIYASGDPFVEKYPFHAAILEMRGHIQLEENEVPALFPVTEQTIDEWRKIYNQKMKHIDNASTLESKDEKTILASGGAYFVHNCGELLGIGWLNDDRIEALASVKHEGGAQVCKALQSIVPQQQLILEVASTNQKAIALYERLGFFIISEKSRWYQVL